MKEQWMANKTPWHEIPHLESGEMHYINRETGELLNAPPSDGIFYKPFEQPKNVEEEKIDPKTLELMMKVKKIQDDAEKKELLVMYQEKFQDAETQAYATRGEATSAYATAEEWHTNEEVQAVLRSWSIEEDDKGRTFYYHQETGTIENDPPDELVSCTEADKHAEETRVEAKELDEIAINAGEAYMKRITLFHPDDTEQSSEEKKILLKDIHQRVSTIRILKEKWEAQHLFSVCSRSLHSAENQEIKLHIESAQHHEEVTRYETIMGESWSVVSSKKSKTGEEKEEKEEMEQMEEQEEAEILTFTSARNPGTVIKSPPSPYPEEHVLLSASKAKLAKHENKMNLQRQEVKTLTVELDRLKNMYIDTMIQSREANLLDLSELAELEGYEGERKAEATKRLEAEKELMLDRAMQNAEDAELRANDLKEMSVALNNAADAEWEIVKDEATGKTYYASKIDGRTQWEEPDILARARAVSLERREAEELVERVQAERDAAVHEAELAREKARNAEIEAVRLMDAVSARYKWRETNEAVTERQSKVDKWMTELDVAKGYRNHEKKTYDELDHEYKTADASARFWSEKMLWREEWDPTSGRTYYVNMTDGGSTTWDRPSGSLSYYFNEMTKESAWEMPEVVNEREECEKKRAEQHVKYDEMNEEVERLKKILEKERKKLEEAELFAGMMKVAARDAANSKASKLKSMGDRSELMKDLLRRVRLRATKGPSCIECGRKRATRRCLTCSVPYCSGCFNRVHAVGEKESHPFLPIGAGSGLVGAGTKSTTGAVYDSRATHKAPKTILECVRCDERGREGKRNVAKYILPTSKSSQQRSMKQKDEEPTDEYMCAPCFKEEVLCQSCTIRVATRACLDCTVSNHHPPPSTDLSSILSSDGLLVTEAASASAAALFDQVVEKVEEELFCTPCYKSFHSRGKRITHLWASVLERRPSEDPVVAEARRRKSVALLKSQSWRQQLILDEKKKTVMREEEEEEEEEQQPLQLVISNGALVPETTVSLNSSSFVSKLAIQRKETHDPQWIGFEHPAMLCCEHYPIQVKGDIKCDDCGGDVFCYTCFDRLHQKGLRKGHQKFHALGLGPPGVPPKPYCEMVVVDQDEVDLRKLNNDKKKRMLLEQKERDEQEKKSNKNSTTDEPELTVIQRIHLMEANKKKKKKRKRGSNDAFSPSSPADLSRFEEGIEYREAQRDIISVSLILHGEMTIDEKMALFKLEHPDSSDTEEDEEEKGEEEKGEEEEGEEKEEREDKGKRKKQRKSSKGKSGKSRKRSDSSKSKKKKKRKSSLSSSSKKKKKEKKEKLPPTINKNLLVRMENPRMTGGLPIISIELAGRITIPDLGQKIIHPEFFDEIYQEKKSLYDMEINNVKKCENNLKSKQQAVAMAIRIRDRASVLIAAKRRKREADKELAAAREALLPVQEDFDRLDSQKFHSLLIRKFEDTKKRRSHQKSRRGSTSQADAATTRRDQKRMLASGIADPHRDSVTEGLPGLNTIELNGLRDGVSYEFRTRVTTLQGTSEWSKVTSHTMVWVTKVLGKTDAEKGPKEFLEYPFDNHPRCIVCFRPATIKCRECHDDVYCEDVMSHVDPVSGDPMSCWDTFHAKEGSGRSNHKKVMMNHETKQLKDWHEELALEKKLAKDRKRLQKYAKQKKKLDRRRKSGMKISSAAAAAVAGEVNDDEFENDEFGDAEILAACTIQSAWRFYRTKQMFGIGKKKKESIWIATKDSDTIGCIALKQGDMLWLWDQIEEPQIHPHTQEVVGYYRAKSMKQSKKSAENIVEGEEEKKEQKEQKEQKEKKSESNKKEISEGPETNDDSYDYSSWSKVPTNVVRRATDHEEKTCREGMLPTWIKMYDPGSVKYYYFNNFTSESVWEEPEDYVEPSVEMLNMGMVTNPEVKSAMIIQRAYRTRQSRRVLDNKKKKKKAVTRSRRAIKNWSLEYDSKHERNYWYNIVTKETTWEMPKELREPKINKDQLLKVILRDYDEDGNEMDEERVAKENEAAAKLHAMMNVTGNSNNDNDDNNDNNDNDNDNRKKLIQVPQRQQSPIGMELIARKRGGGIVKSVKKKSQASSLSIERGHVLLRIGDIDVQNAPLPKIMKLLSQEKRPVIVMFKRPKTIKNMDKNILKKLAENPKNPLRTTLTVLFQLPKFHTDGRPYRTGSSDPTKDDPLPSLGVELLSKRSGGVMIKSLKPGGLASASGKLRRSMTLLEINRIDVSKCEFNIIVNYLMNRKMWNGEGMETVWRVAPSRNLDAEGKQRRVKPSIQETSTTTEGESGKSGESKESQDAVLQTPGSRGRQRERMDPHRPAKTEFEVVWKIGTERSLGLEMAPRKGGGRYVEDKSLEELHEGVILSSLVAGGPVKNQMLVQGGIHLRKGCRLLRVNNVDVSHSSFRNVLELLLTNTRPLHTTWNLAPSRSLTPDGILRQQPREGEKEQERKEKETIHDHEKTQKTEVTVVFKKGTEPLGLILSSRRPRSATQRRMLLGGLTGCGTIVSEIKRDIGGNQ